MAPEMTKAANDSTVFASMVEVAEANRANAGRPTQASAYVADAGYWSAHLTHPVDAEVLITPMPATNGVIDPDDPAV